LKESNVKIAVADAGKGIATSLGLNPTFSNLSELELLKAAVFTEGASGRTSGRYGGFGLKHLRDLATQRSGRLTVGSGGFKLEASRNKPRYQSCPQLEGTIVEVDFRPGEHVQGSHGETF